MLDPASPGSSVAIYFALENGREYYLGESTDADAIGVRALDDRTVEFRLVAPAPYFLSVMNRPDSGPQPRHAIERDGAAWTEPGRQVVSGSFAVASRTDDAVVLQRRDDDANRQRRGGRAVPHGDRRCTTELRARRDRPDPRPLYAAARRPDTGCGSLRRRARAADVVGVHPVRPRGSGHGLAASTSAARSRTRSTGTRSPRSFRPTSSSPPATWTPRRFRGTRRRSRFASSPISRASISSVPATTAKRCAGMMRAGTDILAVVTRRAGRDVLRHPTVETPARGLPVTPGSTRGPESRHPPSTPAPMRITGWLPGYARPGVLPPPALSTRRVQARTRAGYAVSALRSSSSSSARQERSDRGRLELLPRRRPRARSAEPDRR